MMDSFRWGTHSIYGKNTLVAHFNCDDDLVDDFTAFAREMHYNILVQQKVGRDGLTAFVFDVDMRGLGTILNKLHFTAQKE